MTKDELWAQYVARNPSFANDEGTITIGAAGLRKLFSQTYEYGYEAGHDAALTEKQRNEQAVPAFFRGIFPKG